MVSDWRESVPLGKGGRRREWTGWQRDRTTEMERRKAEEGWWTKVEEGWECGSALCFAAPASPVRESVL